MKAGGERTYLTPILNHFRDKPLIKICQAEIDAAAQEIYPRRSPATVNRQLYTPISVVLRHAGVALVLRRPKGASGVKTSGWLWPDEAKRLFAKARALDTEFGVLLTLLCYTGLRLSEALGLTTDQLKLDDAFAFVPTTKNEDPRPVFLPPVVVDALYDHPRGLDRPNERVFKFQQRRSHLLTPPRRCGAGGGHAARASSLPSVPTHLRHLDAAVRQSRHARTGRNRSLERSKVGRAVRACRRHGGTSARCSLARSKLGWKIRGKRREIENC
jgi:integrase